MECKREVLVDGMPGLYAVGNARLFGEDFYVAASENRQGPAVLVSAETKKVYPLTGGEGGVMAALDLEGEDAIFCIEEFYPVFDSASAKLVKIELDRKDDEIQTKRTVLADVPYIHRAAQLIEEDGVYMAAGRLCRHKDAPDDWTTKGPMEIGAYSKDETVRFEEIQDGILKHHAMYLKKNKKGYDDLFFGGEDGVFLAQRESGIWKVEKLLDVPTSDIVFEDLDGDGVEELVIIEGFHGNQATVFKKKADGYQRSLELPLDFGHVLWGGRFLGEMGLITGSRAGEKKLILYRLAEQDGETVVKEELLIDEGQAPAQIVVNERENYAEIIAANHGAAQMVRYRYTK
ncbi:MAG: hypothetical protein Q4B01_02500 [Eubacteriales bacterium]|nr:hypothetical protein [Eubacteriales bacterium]